MTTGMNRSTGAALSGDDHIAQSVNDILTTPLGTRVMLPDYGWLGQEILDRPLNSATALLLASAATMALTRWETRIRVRKVAISGDLSGGQATLTIASEKKGTASNSLTTQTIPLTR